MNLERPNIVVPATNENTLAAIASTPPETRAWDCVELRLDLFDPPPAAPGVPVLLTPRHPAEGGSPRCSAPEQRAELVQPWLPLASALDIEIAHAGALSALIGSARDSEVALVLSFHDFDDTPAAATLVDHVQRGIDLGADVVKLATTTRSPGDVARLLDLFDRFPEQKLAVMGMGKLGKASRPIAAACGSVLNYAAHGEATVEGQWPADEFHRLLEQNGTR